MIDRNSEPRTDRALSNYGLGRVPQFDERSRNFPIRSLIAARQPRSYSWSCPAWLDQGARSACVGFSWAHELAARPMMIPGITDELAFRLYKQAQRIDPWPGEDYSGTSVLAGVQTVQSLGYIDEYRWAFGVDDLALAVSHAGPAVVGIDWHNDMSRPDDTGLIHPTGYVVGGHAILVRGYSVKSRRFLLRNSWGKSWGKAGDCYLTHEDMDALLSQGGEACVPVRRRKGN